MKIAIRADGGSKIGMGHIMRTLVLAKELAKTNVVFYICKKDNKLKDNYKIGIEKVKEEGFEVVTINEKILLKELLEIEADCLITDNYDVDENYFNETKKRFSKTGYIDDMNLYYFNVDFIINQNIHAVDYKYRCNKSTKLFLGTDYVMLREEFRKSTPIKIKNNIEDVLVTVGGADSHNLTIKLINYLMNEEYRLHIIIGKAFNNIEEIKKLVEEKNNIKLYFNPNMIDVMKKCDLAISACGSTLYELAVLGIPTLGIIIADNQENIAKKMSQKGLISNLGWYHTLEKDKMLYIIKKDFNVQNRIELNNKLIKYINNNGIENLVKAIVTL